MCGDEPITEHNMWRVRELPILFGIGFRFVYHFPVSCYEALPSRVC